MTITQEFAPRDAAFPPLTSYPSWPGAWSECGSQAPDPGLGISLILIMQRSLVISNGLRHSTLRGCDQSQAGSGSRDLGQPIRARATLLISKSHSTHYHRVQLSIFPKLFSHWNSFLLATRSNLNCIDLIKLMISVIVLDFTICWVFHQGVFRRGINDGGATHNISPIHCGDRWISDTARPRARQLF